MIGTRSSCPSSFVRRPRRWSPTRYSTIGVAILAFGLVDLNMLATVAGILITHGGKAWYMDRTTLLFADMKGRNSEYASWDF